MGSALPGRIAYPLPNIITLGSGSCISFFLKNFTAAHEGRKDPPPKQAARHTEVAEQNDKGQCFGLTKTSSCNSLMKTSISDYASSSPVSCTPCPKSQALPQPPTMCLVVSVRSPVLGPLRRGPVAHAGAGCNAHFVHFVGMERVEGDLCFISTHFNGGYLICWNQGDTTENTVFPLKVKFSLE